MQRIKPLVSPRQFVIPKRLWGFALPERWWFVPVMRANFLSTSFGGPVTQAGRRANRLYMKWDSQGTEILSRQPILDPPIREEAARIVGGDADDVTLVENASEGLNKVIGSLSPSIEQGDIVIVPRTSFKTLKLLTERLAQRGAVICEAEPTTEGLIQEITAHSNVKAVFIEAAYYVTGEINDVEAIANVAHKVGARIVVDLSQTAGIHLIPLEHVDAAVVTAYKWLYGYNGLGFVFWNRRLWPDNKPENVGWHSDGYEGTGRSHELGGNPWLLVATQLPALRLINSLDPRLRVQHIRKLHRVIFQGLDDLDMGLTVLTPEGVTAAYVSVRMKDDRAREVCKRLNRKGVYLSFGMDRLRISPSIFNGSADVRRTLRLLKKVLREMGYTPGDPAWEGEAQ